MFQRRHLADVIATLAFKTRSLPSRAGAGRSAHCKGTAQKGGEAVAPSSSANGLNGSSTASKTTAAYHGKQPPARRRPHGSCRRSHHSGGGTHVLWLDQDWFGDCCDRNRDAGRLRPVSAYLGSESRGDGVSSRGTDDASIRLAGQPHIRRRLSVHAARAQPAIRIAFLILLLSIGIWGTGAVLWLL